MQRVRVIHIDDEPGMGEIVKLSLESRRDSFEVTTFENPEKGLEYILQTPVDCIVCDYQMPTMDGITLLKQIREASPTLPFILFTSRGSEDIAADAISAGVTDYLRKRTNQEIYELLANRIEKYVEKKDAEQQAVQHRDQLQEHSAAISKKVQTPISEMQSQIDLLSDKYNSEDFEKVQETINQLEETTENLYRLAQEEFFAIEKESIQLDELATHCSEMIPSEGHHIECTRTGTVSVDPTQMAYAIRNLILDRIQRGELEPYIALERSPDSSGFSLIYECRDGKTTTGSPDEIADLSDGAFDSPEESIEQTARVKAARTIIRSHGWSLDIEQSEKGYIQFSLAPLKQTSKPNASIAD